MAEKRECIPEQATGAAKPAPCCQRMNAVECTGWFLSDDSATSDPRRGEYCSPTWTLESLQIKVARFDNDFHLLLMMSTPKVLSMTIFFFFVCSDDGNVVEGWRTFAFFLCWPPLPFLSVGHCCENKKMSVKWILSLFCVDKETCDTLCLMTCMDCD